jgi:CheY-like chemotaxis protein
MCCTEGLLVHPSSIEHAGTKPGAEHQQQPHAVPVLVVDDDPKNLMALDVVLGSEDLRILHASSGEEALRHLLAGREVAVVVLDINMAGLDGLETAALIRGREQLRHTPIIFLTAAADAYESQGYALGAVDYLRKPFDPQALRAKVAVFAELYRKNKALEKLSREATERARLEGALLAIRTAEHELGNQLAAASGELQLLLRRAELSTSERARVQVAVSRIGEAVETVRRMRSLTELQRTNWGTAGVTIDLGSS